MLTVELLQISLGRRKTFLHTPAHAESREMFEFGVKHSSLGVMFVGIEKLDKNLMPEKPLLLQWFSVLEKLKQRNLLLNSLCKLQLP